MHVVPAHMPPCFRPYSPQMQRSGGGTTPAPPAAAPTRSRRRRSGASAHSRRAHRRAAECANAHVAAKSVHMTDRGQNLLARGQRACKFRTGYQHLQQLADFNLLGGGRVQCQLWFLPARPGRHHQVQRHTSGGAVHGFYDLRALWTIAADDSACIEGA